MFRFRDFTSNFCEMAEISTIFGCLKNIKLLECEQIIYHFKTRDLDISNVHFSQNIKILRFNKRFNDFREIYYCPQGGTLKLLMELQ